jgi:hypothetical protein
VASNIILVRPGRYWTSATRGEIGRDEYEQVRRNLAGG